MIPSYLNHRCTLSALTGPMHHTDMLDTYFVWTHCLKRQGPIPIQWVGRNQRRGAT